MTLHLALPLVALLLNVALIAAALAGGGRRSVDRVFVAFAASMVLWNGGVFWLRAAATAEEASFAEVVIHMGVIALPAVYLHFVLAFLDATGSGRRWLRASYAVAAAFTVLNLSGSAWLIRGVARTYWGWAPAPGPLYAPFLVFFNTVLIYGLWRLTRARAAAGSSYLRNRIRLVMLGTIVSIAGGAVDFLRFVVARVVPAADHVYPIGIPANMVFALVLGTAILRYRLFDVSAVMKAAAAYGMVWAVCVSMLVGVVAVVARPGWATPSGGLAVAGVALAVTLILGPVGRWLDRLIRRALFSDSRRGYDRLLALSRELSGILDRKEIVGRLVAGVSRAIPVRHCALLTSDGAGVFGPAEGSVHQAEAVTIEPIAADSALARWLQASGALVKDEALTDPAVAERLAADRVRLAALDAAVLVPLRAEDKLLGILLIGEKLSGEIFSRRELDLLGVVTGQAAAALENARLYEAVRQAYEELSRTQAQNARLEAAVAARARDLAEAHERLTILDRSKDEFLNLISHELRTPLNGLLGVGELILGEIPPTEESNELQGMFDQSRRRLLSILDDALLLTQIDVNGDQFRSAPVPLHAALSRAIERTTEFAESRRVTLIPPSASPDLVLGNEELLVRAFHALLETAVKFSEEGETVRVSRDAVLDSIRVVIESRGRTIPRSVLAKFFELFSVAEASTPGGDLGLGPPVAYRILSLFGASVSVANRDPSGIRLIISLKDAAANRGDSSPS
jgi:signal transduction histidine kinase